MSNSTLIGDYLQQGAGAPSTAPSVESGITAFYWDDSGHALYAYDWVAAAWEKTGGGGGATPFYDPTALALTVPSTSEFSLVQGSNVGGAGTMYNLASRGIGLKQPLRASTNNGTVLAQQATLNSTAFTVAALLHMSPLMYLGNAAGNDMGIYVQDSMGKILSFRWVNYNNGVSAEFSADYWTTIDNYGSNIFSAPVIASQPQLMWMKIQLTGGNFIFSMSFDGETWVEFDSVAASGMGATLSYVGIYNHMWATYYEWTPGTLWSQAVNCYSWTNTTP